MLVHESRSTAKRAAVYARMSTEHQDYSIANQIAALERYAEENNMVIVKRFVDPGKSGLTLRGRQGLNKLLLDVIANEADFEHVLVYDVSRWGRFLDADESAYYEYSCKKANVKVHYCVEPFINDDSVYSALIKNLKRIMAGEYSRELSNKVHAAQVRFAQMGFRQGGTAGYGLRRQLVDKSGNIKGWLKSGDRKAFQSDRIILTAGPKNETDVVRQMFRWFVLDGLGETQIARLLTRRGIEPEYLKHSASRREWTSKRVRQVLSNAKYIGTIIYNRTSTKLRRKRVRNSAEKWVCCEEAFEAIVNPEIYAKAQMIIEGRQIEPDDRQLLDGLTLLWNRVGRLSTTIIDNDPDTPCAQVIRRRFKSLRTAYKLIGYTPRRDVEGIAKRQRERNLGFSCLGDAIQDAVASGKLMSTFTIKELRVACPGWSQASYGPVCALYATREDAKPIKLQRVSRGEYRIVRSQPNPHPRWTSLNDSQILERLNMLLKRNGRLSSKIIANDCETPCIPSIVRRFGSLASVYDLLAYSPGSDRLGIEKRFKERRGARGPGSLAEAIRDAVNVGRLAETFTVAALRAKCPGWAEGTYYSIPKQYATSDVRGPIKLVRVGRAEYRVSTGHD